MRQTFAATGCQCGIKIPNLSVRFGRVAVLVVLSLIYDKLSAQPEF